MSTKTGSKWGPGSERKYANKKKKKRGTHTDSGWKLETRQTAQRSSPFFLCFVLRASCLGSPPPTFAAANVANALKTQVRLVQNIGSIIRTKTMMVVDSSDSGHWFNFVTLYLYEFCRQLLSKICSLVVPATTREHSDHNYLGFENMGIRVFLVPRGF